MRHSVQVSCDRQSIFVTRQSFYEIGKEFLRRKRGHDAVLLKIAEDRCMHHYFVSILPRPNIGMPKRRAFWPRARLRTTVNAEVESQINRTGNIAMTFELQEFYKTKNYLI